MSESLSSRVCMLMVSNALDMSSDVMMVRFGGFLLLNPVVIVLFMGCSAVVVLCCFLNPCWNFWCL